MQKTELLYEGKAKRVYATEDPSFLIVDYKDDATAFNGAKKGTIRGKGVINNQMSNRLMHKLMECKRELSLMNLRWSFLIRTTP